MSERMTVHKNKKGIKKHGFLKRLATKAGKNVVKRRRLKGRKRV